MKGMRGKILKKLKTIGYLKSDRILHANASDGYVYTSSVKPDVKSQTQMQLIIKEEEPKKIVQRNAEIQEPEVIDVSELMKDLDDQALDSDDSLDNKENIFPGASSEILKSSKPPRKLNSDKEKNTLSEIDIDSFRRPDLDSGTLFDPNLLAAFEQVVMEVKTQEAEIRAKIVDEEQKNTEEEVDDDEPPLKARKIEEKAELLSDFEEKCPPGGIDSVILYTTGLRGIRKTFEGCKSVRFLLESFRIMYFERDVSMHLEFREELWKVLGGKELPPKLFVKGRYIGGAEEVLALHEQGKFRPLFEGIPIKQSESPCEGCAGIRFVMCFNCNGSRKIVQEGEEEEPMKCSKCNENGLIICPICS